jgi:hypothetical protein
MAQLQKSMTESFEWNPESHTFRFVDPFIEICERLIQHRHIPVKEFAAKWSLTEFETYDLIGKAEVFVNRKTMAQLEQ